MGWRRAGVTTVCCVQVEEEPGEWVGEGLV